MARLTETDALEVADGADRLVAVFHPPVAEKDTRHAIEVETQTSDLSRVSKGLETIGYSFAYVTRWLD